MTNHRIVRIEWARLSGQRPRNAGCNSRLGEHGQEVYPPIARVTTEDGASGFGWSRLSREDATQLVGLSLDDAFAREAGLPGPVRAEYRALEYPLLDLCGKLADRPVYALVGDGPVEPFRARCYDTTLLIDDLHLDDDRQASELIAAEAMEGHGRGHRSFKIKVGRGAMHMPLEQGTHRDILVIQAVREAVGPECRLMLDANNGLNVNLVKRILSETAGASIHWMEEPFHEDAVLYAHLKEWLAAEGLNTLIADGEGSAHPQLLDWARDGYVDVIQYDVRTPGFSRWLELGPQLDAWGVRSAPHHYGGCFGNYAACHLSAAIDRFDMVEWDESSVDGLDGSAYTIADGWVTVPALPGFGLELDSKAYGNAVGQNGFAVEA